MLGTVKTNVGKSYKKSNPYAAKSAAEHYLGKSHKKSDSYDEKAAKERTEAEIAAKEKEETERVKAAKAETEAETAAKREKQRGEALKYAQEWAAMDVEGLSPEKRRALQYEANQGIKRSQQAAQRKLLGEQGRRGILGKGGVGYAQQRDLHRMAMEEKGAVQRDLDKMNTDLALKKKAMMFAVMQGQMTQAQMDEQLALDQAMLAEEKRRARVWEELASQSFNRV